MVHAEKFPWGDFEASLSCLRIDHPYQWSLYPTLHIAHCLFRKRASGFLFSRPNIPAMALAAPSLVDRFDDWFVFKLASSAADTVPNQRRFVDSLASIHDPWRQPLELVDDDRPHPFHIPFPCPHKQTILPKRHTMPYWSMNMSFDHSYFQWWCGCGCGWNFWCCCRYCSWRISSWESLHSTQRLVVDSDREKDIVFQTIPDGDTLLHLFRKQHDTWNVVHWILCNPPPLGWTLHPRSATNDGDWSIDDINERQLLLINWYSSDCWPGPCGSRDR